LIARRVRSADYKILN